MSDAKMLRELLEEVLIESPQFPGSFYERLFAAHPELKGLFFRSSPDAQQKMFAQKLIMLADSFDEPERLRSELASVEASHRAYGVTREMYGWVGEALVSAVADALGERLSAPQRRVLVDGWATMTRMIFDER